MLKHIVMWKFKPEIELSQKIEMKNQLENLLGIVPTLLKIEIGLNEIESDNSKDFVLYSEFKDLHALKEYANHPEHLKVVEFVKTLVSERHVVDYTF